MSAAAALREFWLRRNSRERVMLSLMLALLGTAMLWYGVVQPLTRTVDGARLRHERAARELVLVEAEARQISALLAQRPPTPAGDALARTILDSAQQAELPISRQRRDARDALVVDIDRVQADALFHWLESLRRDHGIGPHALTISKKEGRLRAQVSFAEADR